MEEIITYGVYWKTEEDEERDKFHPFSAWHTTYDSAYHAYKEYLTNPACRAAQIIERVEHFEIVAQKEKSND